MKKLIILFLLLTSVSSWATDGAFISFVDTKTPNAYSATKDKHAMAEIAKLIALKQIITFQNSNPNSSNGSALMVYFNPNTLPDLTALKVKLKRIFAGTNTEVEINKF